MRKTRQPNSCPMCGNQIVGDFRSHVCPVSEKEDYGWIKVKRYNEEKLDDPNVDWKSAYTKLLKHHNDETTFLINTIKELRK